MVADPLKAARHGLRRRDGAGAMRGDKSSDGLSHALPRSGENAGRRKEPLSDAKREGWTEFAIADCAPGGGNPTPSEASGVPLCTPDCQIGL